jgi:single stranded DNA-binding protein
MSNETTLTITGNLVNDPELRFTPAGQPVAKFRVASTPRYRDNATGEWKDGDSLFLTSNVWRQAAENVAESLTCGMRVIITGRLRQRSYETKEGEMRTVYELEVDELGPSLRNAPGEGDQGLSLQLRRQSARGRAGQLRRQGGRSVGVQRSRWLLRRTAFLGRDPDEAPVRASPPGGCFHGPLPRRSARSASCARRSCAP